jgi:hypothetical protein
MGGILFKIVRHHKSGIDHFVRMSGNSETGQLGGIIFPGLEGFVGKKGNLFPSLPEEADNPIGSSDERIAPVDRSIQIKNESLKHRIAFLLFLTRMRSFD